MGRDSSAAIYLRFALVSSIAVALMVTAFGLLGSTLVGSVQERAAAQSTAAGVAAPVRALLEPLPPGAPLSDDAHARLDDLIRPLAGGDLHSVHVWSADMQQVSWAGSQASVLMPFVPAGGFGWKRATAPDGRDLFVTYTRAGDYTIEIDQSSAGIDAAMADARERLVEVVTVFALVCFVLVQLAFWLGIRRFAAGHRRLLHLYDRGDEIRSSLDLHEVVAHLSREATRLARGSYGMVALYDQSTGDIMLHATYEHATGEIAHHQRAVEEWFLRRCIATNTTVISSQPASVYRQFFGDEVDGPRQMSVLCVPVALRDRVVGVVTVVRGGGGKRGSGFSEVEVQQVEALAAQGVTAVEQAQLFTKVRTYADEIELGYDATLKALMAALDAKDELSEGHCERVARLTVHLARDMGISGQALVDIERGALLHDVGKIGVPDAVLKKPHGLNDLEWEAMRKHPLLAGLMVSKIGFLEASMPILLYHHERYDGGGYPFGLTAEKIPLEARMFSVIDSYDAMTSNRPYRVAMTHDEAMTELAAHSGTQFDPDVVGAFERMMEARPDLRQHGTHRIEAEHDEHDHDALAGENAA